LSGALTLACSLHNDDARKGGDIPYISHLMAVSALVMEHGGTEDQAIAALLHDAIEDTQATYESLSSEVGKAVADIVRACSDKQGPQPKEKTPQEWWGNRKEPYLNKLTNKPVDDPSLLVALADKVHNAEATVADLAKKDPKDRQAFVDNLFNAGWDWQEKWYSGLVDAFDKVVKAEKARPLVDRLRAARNEIFSIDPTNGTM
jgi:(p)ppGpp synthase/HD superfamily hydrolase